MAEYIRNETKELLEGKFLYISDGEYATCIRLYKEGKMNDE